MLILKYWLAICYINLFLFLQLRLSMFHADALAVDESDNESIGITCG